MLKRLLKYLTRWTAPSRQHECVCCSGLPYIAGNADSLRINRFFMKKRDRDYLKERERIYTPGLKTKVPVLYGYEGRSHGPWEDDDPDRLVAVDLMVHSVG